MQKDARQYLSSLRRGLALLALFNQHDTLTTAQTAKKLSLPRTTAQRIITTLIMEGYVERVPLSSLYRLTPAVNILSGGFTDENWITHVGSPMLFEKVQEIGWPLTLATPIGEDMVVRVSTDQVTTSALDHFKVGFRTPIMHSTSGRVVLAYASPEYYSALKQKLLLSNNPLQADVKNEALVQHIVKRIRAMGFEHMVYSEYPEGSIAVPIFLNGNVRACLLVTYIKRAFTPDAAIEQFVPFLKDLATQIERSAVEAKNRLPPNQRHGKPTAVEQNF